MRQYGKAIDVLLASDGESLLLTFLDVSPYSRRRVQDDVRSYRLPFFFLDLE